MLDFGLGYIASVRGNNSMYVLIMDVVYTRRVESAQEIGRFFFFSVSRVLAEYLRGYGARTKGRLA